METDKLTNKVIGAAIKVHRHLGPGLLESTYESCLAFELGNARLNFERQAALPVIYDGHKVDCGYRVDLWIERSVIVEIKAVMKLDPIFTAQVLTYLKLSHARVGLLINFNVPVLPAGLKRIVNNFPEDIRRTRR
jgi:GxxExxY protein